jgi:hypothetical protein
MEFWWEGEEIEGDGFMFHGRMLAWAECLRVELGLRRVIYLSGQLRPMLSLSLSDGARETGCCTYYSIYKEHLFPFLLI